MAANAEKPLVLPCSLPVDKIKNPLLRLLAGLVKAPLEWIFGLRTLNNIYISVVNDPDTAMPFTSRTLKVMEATPVVTDTDIAKIPSSGPLVVISNHPYGAIEGIVLLDQIRRVRPDVKALANYLLGSIREMREDFIFVDPFAGKSAMSRNLKPMRDCLDWLKDGHCLIIFPAGEVAHYNALRRRVCDPKWQSNVISLVEKSGATVLPIYFPGRNGFGFQLAGIIHPRLRTLLLPCELANKKGKKLPFRVGTPIENKELEAAAESSGERLRYLRFRVEILWARKTSILTPLVSLLKNPQAIIEPLPPDDLAAEIKSLPPECRLVTTGENSVYIAKAAQIPNCLKEIGRLREIAFRSVGEGTGKSIDIDEFDSLYRHLFLWNNEKRQIVGAYRLGLTDEVCAGSAGVAGLYTRTLFQFDEALLKAMPPAIEMGRSFIRPEYQKAFTSLFLLWKGISLFLATNPKYRVLFGPVSITREYLKISREMMLFTLQRHYMNDKLAPFVKPTHPPRKPSERAYWTWPENTVFLRDIDFVARYVADMEPDGKDIPVLLRQYLKLNGKFLSFNVDPDFSSVVDGLVVVDLLDANERTIRRYMGNEVGARYLDALHGRQ